MSPYKINRLYQALSASITAPVTELVYASPFELLIAVILSAQATDTSVNQATRELFAKANTPEALLALGWAVLFVPWGIAAYKMIGRSYRN